MPTVIVSYRRSDSRWITGRIVDRLERDLGKGDVFVDIDAIPLGMDFRDHLRDVLDRCDVLLAVIGPNWLAADATGQARIFEPTDWVRVEIETALAKGVPVIPVLIDRAPMPKVSELPESMHAFAFRQAADVDTGRDFHVHMDRLVRAIGQSAAAPHATAGSAPAAAAEQAPRTAPATEEPFEILPARAHDDRRHRGTIAAVVAAAGIAAVAALLTQQWPDRAAIAPSGSTESAPLARDQVPQESLGVPVTPTTASPSDRPVLDVPAPLDPPLPLDPSSSLDSPVPSDRPVPPEPIGQPQRQRAVLFEAEQPDATGQHFGGTVTSGTVTSGRVTSGRVTWRTVARSSSPGQLRDLSAHADVVIPDRQLALTLLLRLNSDPNLPASHTIEISFKLPKDFAPGGVANVPGVLMKASDEGRGTELAGLSARLRPGVFLISLSAAQSDRARNLQLLRDRAWFDLPIVYSNGGEAVLTVEKGADGDRVFKQVLAAWRE